MYQVPETNWYIHFSTALHFCNMQLYNYAVFMGFLEH